MRSAGSRFLVVGLLTLLMSVPLFFAGAIVQDRSFYAEQTRRDVGREWGGPQTLGGPVLVIPVEGVAFRRETRQVADPYLGEPAEVVFDVPYTVRRAPVILLPETFDARVDTASEVRSRGIFRAPVFTADIGLTAEFDPSRASEALDAEETLLWKEATLRLSLTGNAGLRGQTTITGPDGPLDLMPVSDDLGTGIEARVGALSGPVRFDADMRVNGSDRLSIVPVGRQTHVSMTGDWSDPGFTGAFLPDGRQVTDSGYAAEWSIPHLARTLPQVSREGAALTGAFAFGTEFLEVNDFYQKAWRAARYGLLFIALTFLTVLLTERRDHPTHPVQYILIGVAQSLFVLLMVAYAEQVGFRVAYVGSAAATVALLTLFGWIGLKLGRRTFVLGALLTLLYAVLYLIIVATDLALLAGATLAFGALALTIVATRNEDWYGPRGPWSGFRRQAKAASSAISTMSPKED